MTGENAGQTLCRLLAAWIHKTALEPAETPDFEALFQTANRHLLSAAACAALEQTGLMALCPAGTAKRFRTAKEQSIRKTILMDAERKELLAFLEQRGIWYAPLKGAVLNAFYPQYGVRQFSDNDILFDAAYWRTVRDHMRDRGYTGEFAEAGAHYSYEKPPVYRFELHRKLFSDDGKGGFLTACAAYYADVRERLVKDPGNDFGYHFTDEDFYLYFLAHAFKHYDGGGTGLRTLLDVYLYRLRKTALDERYIAGELAKLGLSAFERDCRSLSDKLFGPQSPAAELTADEAAMLAWVESSGVYGTVSHHVQNDLKKLRPDGKAANGSTRVKYLFRWIFPDVNWYRENAPFAYRHRWAVPFFWGSRLFRGVFARRKRSFGKLREIWAPRDGENLFRLAARKMKRILLRPFQKPVSQWPLEKRVAKAMRDYERREGHTFDLEHPVLFTEKRLWYSLFFEHPDLTRLYDKYLFKGYIEEKLGPGWTAPLYGMWTDMRGFKRDWDSLPDAFCLKSNCSSSGMNLKIIRNKESVDVKALFREVKKWLDPLNTGINGYLRAYFGITPRIIAEKLLVGNNGQLTDYKVLCFDGKPEYIYCITDRFASDRNMSTSFYDLDWNKLPVIRKGRRGEDYDPPPHFRQMLKIAGKLSEGFPQIRADFYEAEGKLYIGELTLYAGLQFESEEWDRKFGEKFILPPATPAQ